MVNVFSKNWNTIGNLAIALLFIGGCVFMLTGSWDASESEAAKGCCGDATKASSCCGGTTLVAATTGGCCGSKDRVSGSGGYNCNCLETDNDEADCGYCAKDNNCNSTTNTLACNEGCSDSCGSDGSGFCYDSRSDGERVGDTVCSKDDDYEDGVCGGNPGDDGTCTNNNS